MEIKDVLGIAPVGRAVERLTDASVGAAEAFLGRICLPAAEEFGLFLRDRVKAWRARNALAIAGMAETSLGRSSSAEGVHAHPRLVGQILDYGAWSDVSEVQVMWGGLLASSCTEDGTDDSNLMFIDLLARLSVSQVRILDYACKTARVFVTNVGWLGTEYLSIELEALKKITGADDLHRLDRELDHLRTLGLLAEMGGGFSLSSTNANVTPTTLAVQMYARCNGHRGSPVDFYRTLGTLTSPQDGQDGEGSGVLSAM